MNKNRDTYMIIGRFKCDYCQDQMVIVRYNDSVSVMPRTDYNRIIWKEQRAIYKNRPRKYKKYRKNIERNRKSA